jgi:hypothetical protein
MLGHQVAKKVEFVFQKSRSFRLPVAARAERNELFTDRKYTKYKKKSLFPGSMPVEAKFEKAKI